MIHNILKRIKQLEENKYSKVFIIILILISVILNVLNIISSPIHTDEGWYHHLAIAKNNLGFYTSPAFYDVPAFVGYDYIVPTRFIIQIYRFFDLFLDGKYIIIAVRFLIVIIFSIAVFFYIKSFKLKDTNEKFKFLIPASIIFYPFIQDFFTLAREELIISSIFLFVLGIEKSELSEVKKDFFIVCLLTTALFFHLNSIILFVIFGLMRIDFKNPMRTVYLFFICFLVFFAYYLIFIDPNIPKFTEQFRLMYFSGKVEKFASTFDSLSTYLMEEIKVRYLSWDSRNQITYPVKLLLLLVPIVVGLIYVIKNKTFTKERVFILITLFFLVFVGNKYQGYLMFVFPLLLIAMIIPLFISNKFFYTAVFFTFLIGNIYLSRELLWNKLRNEKNNQIMGFIQENVPEKSIIYASFEFAPYLYPQYQYLTTTQKGGNNFYELFSIKPEGCFILSKNKSEILKYTIKPYSIIAEFENEILYRVEE